ncbi:FKBP-type peptidyl-prolyl cis-trans isomerase [Mucilaginibacter sp. UR6-1]|uniref:FKBP-type peptidyl-prolyl cis-trans isomerase n=1 Tax=Mucilaginibacter sp. UR6-1 TaxID=1435643 RepID=UPI001E2C6717|nr:FKBP-type peptidyl-prolyl cis-trans isomerase [Mucilaginibacter sp. UR6-1]MCC8411014.1 FKBP-type peptidyl-prolyl cis-trans isomerase [Mucilaginibacter sp. UR6-1]
MNRLKYVFGALAIVMMAFTACKKDGDKDTSKQAEKDDQAIQAYIKTYNDTTTSAKINATKDENGIYYEILKAGTGAYPNVNSTISINYTGKLLNGTQFDKGNTTYPLIGFIKGWQLGIPRINSGGRILLLIPSGLAYGSSGKGTIPSNAPLIFIVDLLNFK